MRTVLRRFFVIFCSLFVFLGLGRQPVIAQSLTPLVSSSEPNVSPTALVLTPTPTQFAVSPTGANSTVTSSDEQELAEYQPVAYEAVVTQILEAGSKQDEGQSYSFQKLELEILNKDEKGKKVEVSTDYQLQTRARIYHVGQKVMINKNRDFASGQDFYNITDIIRINTLWLLFAIFIISVIAVARMWGLRSLLAMLFSFAIIFKFLLPQIMAGRDPVFISILSSLLVLPAIFLISHGFNAKSLLALGATFTGLLVSIFLAKLFVEMAGLTGFASEEASFLQVEKNGLINIQSLLLAGIVIGTFGILDDVAVSQVAVVEQIHELKPDASGAELYHKAMVVGQDHISSMINTLVLVYAGSSLSLLLLFYDSSRSLVEIINQEIVAEEIIKTLVGSISLVLIAPISTLFAAIYFGRSTSTVALGKK